MWTETPQLPLVPADKQPGTALCPVCAGPLVVWGTQGRCLRCCFVFCEGCEGEAGFAANVEE
jgi:hypothetical protein